MLDRRTWCYAWWCLLAACSSQVSLEPSDSTCVQGRTTSCTCADSRSGIAVCGGDGAFGACVCESASAGAGGSAGVSAAGTGGTSASGGSAGAGGAAGFGGTGGSAGFGGTGGASGGVGGAAGFGGTGGTGGSAGFGGSGGSGATPQAAAPGELYGPCVNGSCKANLLCATTGTASYCTQACGNGASGVCPAPMTGSVNAQCAFGFCLLGTCANAECPEGMQCVEPSNSGQGGLRVEQCAFPP